MGSAVSYRSGGLKIRQGAMVVPVEIAINQAI
jgi:hypothetical protein